jgi:hypothetical protein
VLVAPSAGVGGVDRVQADSVVVGLGGQAVAEHRCRDPGHCLAEAFTPLTAAHGFSAHGAGVSEVEVFHSNSVEPAPLRVVDEAGDRMPHLGIPARRFTRDIDVDSLRSTNRVAVGVEAPHREVPVVEIHTDDRVSSAQCCVGFVSGAGGVWRRPPTRL